MCTLSSVSPMHWRRHSLRRGASAMFAIVAVLSSAASASADTFVDVDSRGGTCNDTRTASTANAPSTPVCTLARAVAVTPSGGTIQMRAGYYPAFTFNKVSRSARVTIRPFETEEVHLHSAKFNGSKHFRIEGLRLIGGIYVNGGSSNIEIADNDISLNGIMVRPSTSDVLIDGNYIHDLAAGDFPHGFGIWSATSEGAGRAERLTIRGNRITRIPHDAIQLGGTVDVVIEGNDISHVQRLPDRIEHADVLQVLGSDGMIVRNNYFHDGVHAVWAGRIPIKRLVFENNVFARFSGNAMQLSDAPGARIVSNTFIESGYGVRLRNFDEDGVDRWEGVPTTDVVVERNIFEHFHANADSYLASEDYNVILSGYSKGPHDSALVPSFFDPASLDYRTELDDGVIAGAAVTRPATRFRDPADVPTTGEPPGGDESEPAPLPAPDTAGPGPELPVPPPAPDEPTTPPGTGDSPGDAPPDPGGPADAPESTPATPVDAEPAPADESEEVQAPQLNSPADRAAKAKAEERARAVQRADAAKRRAAQRKAARLKAARAEAAKRKAARRRAARRKRATARVRSHTARGRRTSENRQSPDVLRQAKSRGA